MREYCQLKHHRILKQLPLNAPTITNITHQNHSNLRLQPAPLAMTECRLSMPPEASAKKRKRRAFLHQFVIKIAPISTMTQNRANFAIFSPIKVKNFRFNTAHMLCERKIIRGQHEQ
jgi:hypothetical protein